MSDAQQEKEAQLAAEFKSRAERRLARQFRWHLLGVTVFAATSYLFLVTDQSTLALLSLLVGLLFAVHAFDAAGELRASRHRVTRRLAPDFSVFRRGHGSGAKPTTVDTRAT